MEKGWKKHPGPYFLYNIVIELLFWIFLWILNSKNSVENDPLKS